MILSTVKQELEQLQRSNELEISNLVNRGVKVDFEKYARKEENLLSNYFRGTRELFLRSHSKLESARLDSYLSDREDILEPSRYSHIESWFMYGWVAKDGVLFNNGYTRRVSKSMLRYAEFLTSIKGSFS